jgi:phage N-6-adenine-methyltransferase
MTDKYQVTEAEESWLTPPSIVEALGPFDLDPCASIGQPWKTAAAHYTKVEDGLKQPWSGRVWMNPPYGRAIDPWVEKFCAHRNGIALVFARTDTHWFERFWAADALLFHFGRIAFHRVDGSTNDDKKIAASVFIAFGQENVDALRFSGLPGSLVTSHEILKDFVASGRSAHELR